MTWKCGLWTLTDNKTQNVTNISTIYPKKYKNYNVKCLLITKINVSMEKKKKEDHSMHYLRKSIWQMLGKQQLQNRHHQIGQAKALKNTHNPKITPFHYKQNEMNQTHFFAFYTTITLTDAFYRTDAFDSSNILDMQEPILYQKQGRNNLHGPRQ